MSLGKAKKMLCHHKLCLSQDVLDAVASTGAFCFYQKEENDTPHQEYNITMLILKGLGHEPTMLLSYFLLPVNRLIL